jgi:hypothetical protein
VPACARVCVSLAVSFVQPPPPVNVSTSRLGALAVGPPKAGESTPSLATAPVADLVILDFAIFGGGKPTAEDWHNIEGLVRALCRVSNAAVLLLNMPVWCFRANGRRGAGVHHHNVCRRIVYDRARSRAHVAAAASPDQQDAAFRRVAEHYSQVASSVSVFDALQPLIAGGALDLVDFTSDGKHPHVFPLATRRGEVYSRYIADLLAFAIEPRLLKASAGSGPWRGIVPGSAEDEDSRQSVARVVASEASDAAGARRVGVSRRTATGVAGMPPMAGLSRQRLPSEPERLRPRLPLPPPLAPPLAHTAEVQGIRCYGWGARATRGKWEAIMAPQAPPAGHTTGSAGWRLTRQELAWHAAEREWRPAPSESRAGTGVGKPGLTSVTPGDVLELEISTSLEGGNRGGGGGGGKQGGGRGEGFGGEHAAVQVTYLQSYEQVGVVHIECVRGCSCAMKRLDALVPGRLATLNTALWRVSEARKCTLRLTNKSPPGSCGAGSAAGAGVGGAAPCTKIKLVALAVAAFAAAAVDGKYRAVGFNASRVQQFANQQVSSSIELGFL